MNAHRPETPSRMLRLLGIGAATALLATGCIDNGDNGGGGDNGDGEAPEGGASGSLHGPIQDDPTSIDPALGGQNADYWMNRLTFDTVVRRDDEAGFVPGLATDWEETADSVLLTIREDAVCDDGTEITPTVVADSFSYFADPDTGAQNKVGVFGTGEVTVTADDDEGTVLVELDEPYSELLVGLTHPSAGIICPAGLEDLDGLNTGDVEGAYSGPYRVTEYNTGVNYEFTFNETYDHWPEYTEPLEGHPAETISFTPRALDAGPNQVTTGEMDFTTVEHQDMDRFPEDEWNISRGSLGEHYLVLNYNGPLADHDVRYAVAQALSQEDYREVVNPEADLIQSAGHQGVPCVNTDDSLLVEPDEDAAAEVLDGVELFINSTNVVGPNGAGGEYLAEALRAAGADVELSNTDVGTWVDMAYSTEDAENWDITLWSTVNVGGNLVNGISRVVGPTLHEGGRNFAYVENPEADEAYERALAADSEEEKCEAFQEVQEIVLEDVAMIPLASSPSVFVMREGVTKRHVAESEDVSTLRIVE